MRMPPHLELHYRTKGWPLPFIEVLNTPQLAIWARPTSRCPTAARSP